MIKKILYKALSFILGDLVAQEIKLFYRIFKIRVFKLFESLGFSYYSNPYKFFLTNKNIDDEFYDLEKIMNKKNGLYFEIGACDGWFESPTYLLSVKYNWHGVLADANNEFLQLVNYYRPKDEVVHAACGSFEMCKDKSEIDFLNLYHSGEVYFDDKSSSDWALKQIKENNKKPSKAPLKTITDIILNSKLLSGKRIDLIVLDVEGFELEILKGYDFKSIKTDYFLIECRTADEFINIKEFLLLKDYNFLRKTSSIDYLFINHDL